MKLDHKTTKLFMYASNMDKCISVEEMSPIRIIAAWIAMNYEDTSTALEVLKDSIAQIDSAYRQIDEEIE